MKVYSYQDSDAYTLTTAALSLNGLLKHYLVPLLWEIDTDSGSFLTLKNSAGRLISVKDVDNKAYFRGYRSDVDHVGFPLASQSTIDATVGVLSRRATVDSWTLFADTDLFYLIINGELVGFGVFESFFEQDIYNYMLIGNSSYSSNQILLVNPNQYSSTLFTEGLVSQFPFSKQMGLSLYHQIDQYNTMTSSNPFLSASPIAIHDPSNSSIRGFLSRLFAFNSSFSHEGEIYSQGGYTLYCIAIGGRCFGVQLNA